MGLRAVQAAHEQAVTIDGPRGCGQQFAGAAIVDGRREQRQRGPLHARHDRRIVQQQQIEVSPAVAAGQMPEPSGVGPHVRRDDVQRRAELRRVVEAERGDAVAEEQGQVGIRAGEGAIAPNCAPPS